MKSFFHNISHPNVSSATYILTCHVLLGTKGKAKDDSISHDLPRCAENLDVPQEQGSRDLLSSLLCPL
jgi:hypothetical protein